MLPHAQQPLRLSRIRVSNIRCFEQLDIDLSSGDGPRPWVLIFGDNGVGKTTLLRCIAMGLCDATSSAGLLREIYGEWHRVVDDQQLRSEIRLEFFTARGKAVISTSIEPQASGYSQVSQTTTFEGKRSTFPWDLIFACGYGSARRAFGSQDINEYAAIDAVYTLFNYDTPLQNPELVLRRLDKSRQLSKGKKGKRLRTLLDSLAAVLMLPSGSIALATSGLTVSGPWGAFQPIGGLGDGFQATLAWICDLIGWALMYDEDRPLSELQGIVLIDEIEQHLHPRWQRKIVKLLSDQFPHVQFIATTHTPMCAIGTTELECGTCELIKLNREGSSVQAIENLAPPYGQRADQILTSLLFGLPTSGDDATIGEIALLNDLAMKDPKLLTSAEKEQLNQLRIKLSTQFDSGESELQTAVRKEVRAVLEARKQANISLIAADYEIMRQLRELAK